MGKSFNSLQESLLIKSRMGVMLHDDMLYPQLSVKENLIFYSRILGIKDIFESINKISSILKLEEYMNVQVIKLCIGNKSCACTKQNKLCLYKTFLLNMQQNI